MKGDVALRTPDFKEYVIHLHSSSVVLTGASPHYVEFYVNDASLIYFLENPC